MAIFILMMDKQELFRTASLAGVFAKLAISLNATLPHWVARAGMFMLSAYRCVVALPRTVATNLQAMFRDGVTLSAKFTCKRELFFVPSTNLFTVGAIATKDGTEHSLAFFENLSAGTFHAVIVPIGAA